jgi:hypothetical protein
MYICIYVHVYIYIFINIYIYTHTRTHTHTHTCLYIHIKEEECVENTFLESYQKTEVLNLLTLLVQKYKY